MRLIFKVHIFVAGLLLLINSSTSSGELSENIEIKNYTKSSVCGKCHTKIYEAWQRSLHANATKDPIFQTAIFQSLSIASIKDVSKCFSCHAPAAKKIEGIDFMSEDVLEGITCDYCHSASAIDKGRIPALRSSPGLIKYGPHGGLESPAHKTQENSIFKKSEFCMACHEYWNKGTGILTTYSEWKASKFSSEGVQCQNCHMPYVEGELVDPSVKRSLNKINLHEPPGGRSAEQLKKAAEIKILSKREKEKKWDVEVQIINTGAGHKLPTGLPSRYLMLEFSAETDSGRKIFTDSYKFMKIMGDANGKPLYKDYEIMNKSEKILSDNRLSPGEVQTVVFSFIAPEDGVKVNARLIYVYEPYVITRELMSVEIGNVKEKLR